MSEPDLQTNQGPFRTRYFAQLIFTWPLFMLLIDNDVPCLLTNQINN